MNNVHEMPGVSQQFTENPGFLKTILEAVTEGVIILDRQGKLTFLNRGAEGILGISRRKALGRPWSGGGWKLISPLKDVHPEDPFSGTMARGESTPAREMIVEWQNGTRKTVSLQVEPLTDHSGSLRGAVGILTDLTGRKQSEKARALEKKKTWRRKSILGRLIREAPLGIAVIRGSEPCFEFVNANYQACFDLPDSSMAGRPVAGAFPEGTCRGVLSLVEAVYQTGRTVSIREMEVPPRPDRKRAFYDVDYAPLKNPSGRVDGVLVLARDATERVHVRRLRETEHLLHRREEKYRLLFENLSEALACDQLVFDERGKPADWIVTDINPAYEAIMQVPREKAVGQRASVLYGQALEIKPILDKFAQVAATGKPNCLEVIFPPGGKHLLLSIFPLGDGRVATMTKDITGRKRIEDERECLLAELDATINGIADAVVIYRSAGEIIRMNPAAEKMLGPFAPGLEAGLRQRLAGLKVEGPDGRPYPLEESMLRACHGEAMRCVLLTIRRSEGKPLWLSHSAAPIRTPDGRLVGAVGTFTDITRVHEVQEQRDAYVHTISHDLRVPLTVIHGYAELLEEDLTKAGRDGDSKLMAVERILECSREMTAMINDLVDAARLEGGKLTLKKERVVLASFIDGLLQRSEAILDVRRLAADIPMHLPAVLVDPHHLERILLNLLTNALKYSPAGSPVLVEARKGEGGVRISVVDRGQGIDPEDLSRVFDRFSRAKGSGKTEGIGLGLYISRMLVEANSGRIGVESEPGQGSSFFFILPPA